jgi:hypothetical protein
MIIVTLFTWCSFLLAIRFVLGDAYQNLTKEERQALLHVR